jgi:uncharacterized paraquat-inducible protein A
MISALCSICGEATKNPHSCLACGAAVCEKHYDFASGFCPRCRHRLKRVETMPEPRKSF